MVKCLSGRGYRGTNFTLLHNEDGVTLGQVADAFEVLMLSCGHRDTQGSLQWEITMPKGCIIRIDDSAVEASPDVDGITADYVEEFMSCYGRYLTITPW